jgi:hypothetical protein
MEIKLSDYQRSTLEQALLAKQNAEKIQEEILDMVFAYNKVARPTTQISYNDGKLSWTETPEVIEG